jgi:hypothetical protein
MDVLSLSGSSETVDVGVTDIQNYCVGGNFDPDCVTGGACKRERFRSCSAWATR